MIRLEGHFPDDDMLALYASTPALSERIAEVYDRTEELYYQFGGKLAGTGLLACAFTMLDREESLLISAFTRPQELYQDKTEVTIPYSVAVTTARNMGRIGMKQTWYMTDFGAHIVTQDYKDTFTVVHREILVNPTYASYMEALRTRMMASDLSASEPYDVIREELLAMYDNDLAWAQALNDAMQADSQGRATDVDVSIMLGSLIECNSLTYQQATF